MSEVIDISPGNLKAQAGIKIAGSSTVKTVIGKNKQTNKTYLTSTDTITYKQKNSQDLLYSTRSYSQYILITYNGNELEKEYIKVESLCYILKTLQNNCTSI